VAEKQNAPEFIPRCIPARESAAAAGKDPETGAVIPHKRDEKTAGQVEAMAALGFSDEEIAVALNLRPGQVRHYYAGELEVAPVKANMQVAKAFYDVAKSGKNWQASLSWLKARAGWKDGDQAPPGAGLSVHIHL
jgi:hypothetical protein